MAMAGRLSHQLSRAADPHPRLCGVQRQQQLSMWRSMRWWWAAVIPAGRLWPARLPRPHGLAALSRWNRPAAGQDVATDAAGRATNGEYGPFSIASALPWPLPCSDLLQPPAGAKRGWSRGALLPMRARASRCRPTPWIERSSRQLPGHGHGAARARCGGRSSSGPCAGHPAPGAERHAPFAPEAASAGSEEGQRIAHGLLRSAVLSMQKPRLAVTTRLRLLAA